MLHLGLIMKCCYISQSTKRLHCFFRYESSLQSATIPFAVIIETREKDSLKELLVFIINPKSLICEKQMIKTPTSIFSL